MTSLKWIYKPEPDEEVVDRICTSLGFGTFESKLLVLREIDTYEKARAFFKPKIEDIHNPFLMADMQKAVERIANAIENGEKILVYGDYDVDGTTAVAVMYLFLSKIVEKKYLDFYIPNRNSEGYGVSKEGIDFAKENNFTLIIALDCGIKASEQVEYAQSLGIDFIICDHHLPGESLPKAHAVLDPKRKDCRYPYKELSGCGVGYKLCQGLNTFYQIPDEELFDLCDLLAISIAADIVEMKGENRVFAKLGLKRLRKTRKIGLRLLVPPEKLSTFRISNIVFEIAPKINAAGRISHGKASVELMVSENLQQAKKIVQTIMDLNDERRELDMDSTQSAVKQVVETNQVENASTIVYDPNWNKGVIGIVASRLTEVYYKPTLVFTDGNEGEIVASGRTVSDYDIHKALDQCSAYFLKFGGHPAAAGLSMLKSQFDAFKVKFEEVVKASIQDHQKVPSIKVDAVMDLDDLNRDFISFHRKLAPFGPKNMKPVLVLKNLKVSGYVKMMGKENGHLKFFIKQPSTGKSIECIGFKLGRYADEFKTKQFDIAFTLEENHWKGNVTHYLSIKDVKFNESI